MPLGTVLIVLLALVWAAVLLPSLFRSRFKSSTVNGIRSFEQAMGVLAGARKKPKEPGSGRWIMVPRSELTAPIRRRARVMRRRRKSFLRLLAAVPVTLGLAFVPGLQWMLLVHLAVDAALGVYIWRLRRWKLEADPRAATADAASSSDEPDSPAAEERELARRTG